MAGEPTRALDEAGLLTAGTLEQAKTVAPMLVYLATMELAGRIGTCRFASSPRQPRGGPASPSRTRPRPRFGRPELLRNVMS